MLRRRVLLLSVCVLAALLSGCGPVPDPGPPQSDCGRDDPRIGWSGEIAGWIHGVRGTARIVDDCTIVIDHFYYDGIGLDVRIVGFSGNSQADLKQGVILTKDIRRVGGYTDETLTLKLPDGVTPADVPRLSVC